MRRFYLSDAAPPTFDPASTVKGAWDDVTDAADSGGLLTLPSGATANFVLPETSVSPTWDVLLAHWTSQGVGRSFTMGGTVRWAIAVQQSSASGLFVTHVHIWVTQGQSTNVRGTLLQDYIGSRQWPTTAQGIVEGPIALNDVQVQLGDCIAVEVGYQAQNTSASSFSGTQWFGSNNTSPDLTDGDTNVTLDPSWFEFSQDFTLGHVPNRGLRPRPFAPGIAR